MKKKISVLGDNFRIKVFDEYNTPIADSKNIRSDDIEDFLRKLQKKMR